MIDPYAYVAFAYGSVVEIGYHIPVSYLWMKNATVNSCCQLRAIICCITYIVVFTDIGCHIHYKFGDMVINIVSLF